jgi:hypothetical protein
MFDLVRVTEVRYLGGHSLWLRFSDGLEGTVDLADSLRGPVLEALLDPLRFSEVRVDGPSIGWPNGADWSPEWLHDRVLATNGTALQSGDDGRGGGASHYARMPEISRFYGIVVRMFYVDHARPHFHAQYGEHSIAIEILGDGVRGSFPPNRLPLLFEWRDKHRDELMANWDRLRDGTLPLPIAALE